MTNSQNCTCHCSVDLGEKGMEALITLGAGDMRRTLNILQVAVRVPIQPAKLKLVYTLSSRQTCYLLLLPIYAAQLMLAWTVSIVNVSGLCAFC
jgi:hypothetical protein